MEPQLLTGRCLCEGIANEIRGELGPIYNCHCSRCRRWHGAAFRTRATIRASQFKWIKGGNLLSRFHSSELVVKHFCRVCGSNLISTYDNDPEGNIWVANKAPWYDISDGLPQYDTWPGSHDKVRETDITPQRHRP